MLQLSGLDCNLITPNASSPAEQCCHGEARICSYALNIMRTWWQDEA